MSEIDSMTNEMEFGTCAALAKLLQGSAWLAGPDAVFETLRAEYLRREMGPGLAQRARMAGVTFPPGGTPPAEPISTDWGDVDFHLKHRIHLNRKSTASDLSLLFELAPYARSLENSLKRIIFDGVQTFADGDDIQEHRFYDLSILPLNLVLGPEVVSYFLPSRDYLEPHSTKHPDPYGIINGQSRARIGRSDRALITERNLIIGTHKFTHTLLFNIDFQCPIGCADCYKAKMGTREYLVGEFGRTPNIYRHPELGVLRAPTAGRARDQARGIVRWMNEDPRGRQVYDVILSGGEPLSMSNELIGTILEEFRGADNLRNFRICTGALFLGLPFRFDDDLLLALSDFEAMTGVRVTIHAHLGSHQMISPEALIAVNRIRRHGFSIYSQVPIKNGTNFFLDDVDRTLNALVELGRKQVRVGVEPYMFIVDMHPSTNDVYVPLEPLLQTWSALVESHDFPGLERPRTLSILFKGGNIILSSHALFSSEKRVDRQNDRVVYHIPRVGVDSSWGNNIAESFVYEEPLMEGINDDPESLNRLRRLWDSVRERASDGGR